MSQAVKLTPSQFAESVFMLDGRPFRLTGRKYLRPIYDRDIEFGMIMSGRQVEKSTTNATNIATQTLTKPHFKALYVAPLNQQVKEFSVERIGKFYSHSQGDVINRFYRTKNDTNNVFYKQFSGVDSTNYFKHCFDTGDNIRGITVNGIWLDEIQDIHIDAVPVIQECQSHALEAGARTKVTWFTGTPKTFGNTIQQYWERSTQNEWIVTCPHCNTKQILGVENMEPTRYVCRKCKMALPDDARANGFWLPIDRTQKIEGFHISQLMVPWIKPEEVWTKYETYSRDKFFNEVMGRSYENSEKPFTIVELRAICNNDYYLMERPMGYAALWPMFLGVDWGTGEKSYTITEIYAQNPTTGQRVLVYAKKYAIGQELDMDWQVEHISALMNIFQIKQAVVDWGFGYQQAQQLYKRFGTRVVACYYSSAAKKERYYDPNNKRWVVNRSALMQKYIDDVKTMRQLWPGKNINELEWLFDHHLAETAEYRKSYNGRSEDLMYSHPAGSPDDGLHAGVYAKLASEIFNSMANAQNITFTGVRM